MKRHAKPVGACYACVLNLGDHCGIYAYPRGQWRSRRCAGFDDPEIHRAYEALSREVQVKTRRELRQELFRSRRRKAFVQSRDCRAGSKG